ncbi:MAG: universal stress protein [Phormidium sp. GEM2.Bin31]|nr:universal stress protein [Phormidium sp. BM_Day4_Bin.17]TVR09369.1 MAG: universal stress protein [Phormidium sp. GEM2.Bin31]UCJ11283.1 MAG: universal stress protein [Phormidium sp. PBR-2020]
MIERILVAVAGRGLCEEMLNQLLDIPEIQRAEITVLHVVPPQVSADLVSEKLEEGGRVLAQAVKSLKVDPSKINPRLKQGDPKTIVCDVAKEENADLIIMGSRGLGRLVSILENSVSQYVFQLADRPMLLVKDEVYVKRLKRVMVALDASESAQESLDLTLSWVKDLKDAKLILTHVNPPDKNVAPENDPVLKAASEKAKRLGLQTQSLIASGKAGPEICRLAEDNNVDLLVLGSPDRRPNIAKALPDLDRLLGQSLSDYVRVYANCPVLLAR